MVFLLIQYRIDISLIFHIIEILVQIKADFFYKLINASFVI